WILPNISWSPNGGWNFGISAGIGMPGFGIYASIGYAPKANDFSVSIGASIGGFNASMGYNSSMGYNFGVGYNFGIPGSETMSPFNIMTNFTSFGTHWTQKGGWNASISSVSIGRNGATYNPEIGIGVTWAKGVAGVAELSPNEYINLGLEVDYIAEISTNEQLAEFLESNGININDYGADKIDIEGLSKIIERKGYYRVFGIIQNATGADIGGICEYGFNGFSAYADIYLSPHNSEHSLMISLNHEFIHSWQWKTLGRHFAHSKKLKANFDIFTETSASLYTKQFYPNFYVPKYEGIFSPYIRRWPQLPVIN
ncbi:hypothetical protein LJB92_04525, partial [Bacteroidales bacterium OttesenSCG-928-M06]|nr:hypothetical protein [Bacteroidales bacterium OttesenSCG-928-M06]